MRIEVKRCRAEQSARAIRGGASGIYIPRFRGLIILRGLRLAFTERHNPCDNHDGEHEQKCRAGHSFEHRAVPLIFIRIADEGRPVSPSLTFG
jgi:hypothetical protein